MITKTLVPFPKLSPFDIYGGYSFTSAFAFSLYLNPSINAFAFFIPSSFDSGLNESLTYTCLISLNPINPNI